MRLTYCDTLRGKKRKMIGHSNGYRGCLKAYYMHRNEALAKRTDVQGRSGDGKQKTRRSGEPKNMGAVATEAPIRETTD